MPLRLDFALLMFSFDFLNDPAQLRRKMIIMINRRNDPPRKHPVIPWDSWGMGETVQSDS